MEREGVLFLGLCFKNLLFAFLGKGSQLGFVAVSCLFTLSLKGELLVLRAHVGVGLCSITNRPAIQTNTLLGKGWHLGPQISYLSGQQSSIKEEAYNNDAGYT